jgi:hypothetical protein
LAEVIVNALIGGSISLQPLSLQIQTSLNPAGSIACLDARASAGDQVAACGPCVARAEFSPQWIAVPSGVVIRRCRSAAGSLRAGSVHHDFLIGIPRMSEPRSKVALLMVT